jgi:hypothetical protein
MIDSGYILLASVLVEQSAQSPGNSSAPATHHFNSFSRSATSSALARLLNALMRK